MKLLLTSAGITNKKIADVLIKLSNKRASEIKLCAISTASYSEEGNKDWYIKQYTDLIKFGFKNFDIVDISNKNINWKKRLEKVEVVYVGGGNTFYLLDQVKKTGFDKWIKSHPDKIYVGVSAGSIIMTPFITVANVEPADDNFIGLKNLTGLNLVDFEVSPHTPEVVKYKDAKKYAKNIKNKIVLLDDNSAILVNGKVVKVVSDGKWVRL